MAGNVMARNAQRDGFRVLSGGYGGTLHMEWAMVYCAARQSGRDFTYDRRLKDF